MIGDRSSLEGRRPLLVRPVVESGESWAGYLLRLSSANSMGGIVGLAKSVSMTAQQFVAMPPWILLPALGIDWAHHAGEVAETARALPARRVSLETRGRSLRSRVCPLCLADRPLSFAPARWDHPLELACRIHGVQLLDKCSTCAAPLSALRPSLTHCACGADITRQAAVPTPGWMMIIPALFPEAQRPEQEETFAPADRVAQSAARACLWLAAGVDQSTRRRPRKFKAGSPVLTIEAADRLSPLLVGWPQAAIASLCLQVGRGDGHEFQKVSTRLATRQFVEMQRLLDRVKEATRTRTQRSVSCAMHLRKGAPRQYGIKDLIRATGYSYQGLVHAIDAGRIPGAHYTTDAQTGAKRFVIEVEAFREIETAHRTMLTVRRAAAWLGCSEAAVRGLVSAECLRASSLLESGFGYRVSQSDLVAFREELVNLAVPMIRISLAECVRFSQWILPPYARARAAAWALVLRAIRSSRVAVLAAGGPVTGLDQLYLRELDLTRVKKGVAE